MLYIWTTLTLYFYTCWLFLSWVHHYVLFRMGQSAFLDHVTGSWMFGIWNVWKRIAQAVQKRQRSRLSLMLIRFLWSFVKLIIDFMWKLYFGDLNLNKKDCWTFLEEFIYSCICISYFTGIYFINCKLFYCLKLNFVLLQKYLHWKMTPSASV